jgi:hypothetical protein
MLGLLIFLAGFVMAGRASAQNIPEPHPECVDTPQYKCHGGSTSTPSAETEEERRARWEAIWQARRERKEQKDAENKARQEAKAEAKRQAQQRAEEERLAAIDAQRRKAEEERQQAAEAERQRLLAIEAQRLQAAFNEIKPEAISSLKGVDGAPSGISGLEGGLGLKGLDDAPRMASTAWDAQITDPEVAIYAKRLDSVVPPLPLPQKEVAVTWKQVYLNNDRLMNTTDLVVTAWEVTGVVGEKMSGPVDWLIIGGKTLIAGENGAYMHLVNREKDYDAALAFLKNPAQAQQFAHLVQDIRENRALPASANPNMVKAARAITDPKLGNSGVAIAIDSMMSKEAASAMFRKAAVEVMSKKLSDKAEDLIKDMSARKVLYDYVRAGRDDARKMLALESTTKEQRKECEAVIARANQLTAAIYKAETVAHAKDAYDIGEATDKLAETFFGPEAQGREY